MVFEAKMTTPIPSNLVGIDTGYKFSFTKDFVVFPEKLKKLQKTHLLTEFIINNRKFSDYDKYTSIVKLPALHPERTKFSRFQVQFESGEKFNLIMSEWDIFKMNIIHDKYWLLNEKKWFVTFLLSLAAIIISIIALSNR